MNNNSEQKAIIRHANKLIHYEIAKLNPVAQNLMALLFSIWTKDPKEQTVLDLSFIRNSLDLGHQEDAYLENIILKTGKEIVDKSFIAVKFDGGAIIGSLIYWFKVNNQTKQLEVSTTPAFMDLFRKLKEGYTEYDFLIFYRINSKQAKNIYYLCRKNFKGHFTMDWSEFRLELGFKESARNSNIIALVKKAVDYLVQQQYLKTCQMTPIYGSGRGRPLVQVHFEYTFSDTSQTATTIDVAPETPAEISQDGGNAAPKSLEPVTVASTPTEALPASEPEPFDPATLRAVTSDEAREAMFASLPKIEDVIAEQQKHDDPFPPQIVMPENDVKRLEMRCPKCGESMVIRENSTNHSLFWACPRVWNHQCSQKTITLPAELAEIYRKKHDKD